MKGLLKKDLIMLVKYGRMTLLSCLFFTVVSCFTSGNLFYIIYPVAIGSVLAQSLQAYDERSGWDRYCDALPVSRTQLVTEKYLVALLLFGCFFLLGIIGQLILKLRTGSNSFMTAIAVMAAGGLLVPSVLLPFTFHFGTEKGRMAYMLCIGLICALIAGASARDNLTGREALVLNGSAAVGIILIAVAVFAVSWRVSAMLYEKRELT